MLSPSCDSRPACVNSSSPVRLKYARSLITVLVCSSSLNNKSLNVIIFFTSHHSKCPLLNLSFDGPVDFGVDCAFCCFSCLALPASGSRRLSWLSMNLLLSLCTGLDTPGLALFYGNRSYSFYTFISMTPGMIRVRHRAPFTGGSFGLLAICILCYMLRVEGLPRLPVIVVNLHGPFLYTPTVMKS